MKELIMLPGDHSQAFETNTSQIMNRNGGNQSPILDLSLIQNMEKNPNFQSDSKNAQKKTPSIKNNEFSLNIVKSGCKDIKPFVSGIMNESNVDNLDFDDMSKQFTSAIKEKKGNLGNKSIRKGDLNRSERSIKGNRKSSNNESQNQSRSRGIHARRLPYSTRNSDGKDISFNPR